MPNPFSDFFSSTGQLSSFGQSQFFQEQPEAAYYSLPQAQQGSFNQKQFFQSQFRDIFNEYLGGLGQQIRGGQMPTQQFENFLGGLNFQQRFGAIPPAARGMDTTRLNPFTQWRV